MRATLLHAFLVTQYSGALLVRRPLRPRAGAVVRTAAGSVARCEEKITAALEPTSLRVTNSEDDPNGTHVSIVCVFCQGTFDGFNTRSGLHTGLCTFRGTFARQTPTACHAEHPRRA
mmetsp:Transcript_14246/g.40734  ORF Transcript_14246/g.40734 Transcript_14246/m.40734 type:complete len:117 (-) Transcript_14246:113-463(-)